MLKAIKIRLYPNQDQITYINKLLGCSRFVYNQCLTYKSVEYGLWSNPTGLSDTNKFVTELKGTYEWLKESHSKVIQQSLINLETAYKNFFKKKSDYPTYKKKSSQQSCRFPTDAIMGVKGNRISIIRPLKDIHYKCSNKDTSYLNQYKKKFNSGTLTKTKSGDYYFSVLLDRPNKELKKIGDLLIGIDLGIKDFIVTSEGQRYENLKSKRNNHNKLARVHRELSRKKKGSKNRIESRIKLAKTYEKLNNVKEYYLHSVTNQLLSENQTIVMENLNVKGMLKNHHLARSIQEVSWSRFKDILKYKAEWYGREVIEVSRWFPSSKLCGECGYINSGLTLKERFWVCPKCNTLHDRDLNASNTIKKEGIKIKIGLSSPELTPQEGKPEGPRRMRKENVELMCVII
jgi:putative transposase